MRSRWCWAAYRRRSNTPTTLTAYVLVDGDHERAAEVSGAADLDVAGHPVHLDLAALTRR